MIHVPAVEKVQALNILAWVHNLLQIRVLATTKDRIVDHNAIDALVAVRRKNQVLYVRLETKVLQALGLLRLTHILRVVPSLPDFKIDADSLACLGCPFRVRNGGWARLGKNAHKLWDRKLFFLPLANLRLNAILEWLRNGRCLKQLAGVLWFGLGHIVECKGAVRETAKMLAYPST